MIRDRGAFVFTLYVVVGRAVVFFFVFSLLLFLVYLLGNFQDFLDATQLYLLGLLRVSLLAELFAGLLYIISVFALRRGRRRAFRLVLCVFSMAFSYAMLLGLSFLASWFRL